MRRVAQERAHAVRLPALDVEQEHVRRVGGRLDRELAEQARLQRSDADDEERAEPDGEQDDARLVAGPGQVQHRVPQRERPRVGERRDQGDEHPARHDQHHRQPGETGADHQADLERRRLPRRQPDQRRRHRHEDGVADPVAPARRAFVAQQQRRLDEADVQQRHDREQERHEHADADALRRRARRHPVVRLGEDRRRPAERDRDRRDRRLRDPDAEQAAGQAERHHLQDVDRDDLPAACADALQHRDAAHLLQDEHAGDARHRDAAEDHDDQADEAQVVLGALEIAADLIFGRPVGPGVDELVAQLAAEGGDERLELVFRRHHVHPPVGAAAEAEQPGRRQVGVVDQHARAEAEAADPPPRLALERGANRERRLADRDLVAHLHAERRQQLRPHDDAVVLQQRVRVRLPVDQDDGAVQRKVRLHGAQLGHLRHRLRRIGRPHHRRRLERFGPGGGAGIGERAIDGGPRRLGPVAVGRNQHVGGDERPRLAADHPADALDHRAQGDDRGDADGDADEEEQQAPPRRARFARRHPEDEHHRSRSRAGAPALAPTASLSASRTFSVFSTTRPSRIISLASAIAASSASCVTRTMVVPRPW